MIRLAIITTHPIQYNDPWFKLLATSKTVSLKIFYTWEQTKSGSKHDIGFGKIIEWDIPLLNGYQYAFVKNTSKDPGTHHFKGIINPTLIQEIKKWDAQIILVIGWSFYSHLKCIRYFHNKIPVLFRGDSTLLDEKGWVRKRLRRVFLKWLYRHIDYALYVGTNNKNYFLKHGLKEDQLIFTPHAIDNARFNEPDEAYNFQASDWRHKLGIDKGSLVLLFAGKFEPKKNPFFLIDLAKKIPNKNIRMIFVGDGILEGALKKAAIYDERIKFISFQNQQIMPVVYRLGDIFILPSQGSGETWGLAANEAMASGRAIMLSEKCGAATDLVKEGKNGIIFQLNDFKKCQTFINTLITDKNKLESMQQFSRKFVNNFSFDHIVNAIESICEQIQQLN